MLSKSCTITYIMLRTSPWCNRNCFDRWTPWWFIHKGKQYFQKKNLSKGEVVKSQNFKSFLSKNCPIFLYTQIYICCATFILFRCEDCSKRWSHCIFMVEFEAQSMHTVQYSTWQTRFSLPKTKQFSWYPPKPFISVILISLSRQVTDLFLTAYIVRL